MGIIGNMPEYFEEVETTEAYDGYWYSVKNIITIVILGSLCGLKNLILIHEWAKSEKVKEYLQRIKIPRVPCYSQITVIMGIIEPKSLGEAFEKWINNIVSAGGKTISLDGKTEKSTEKMGTYEQAVHIVSAQMSELGLTIGTECVASKSNEIPAVQELIKRLEIKDTLIVADALNCQTETAKAIIGAKADYLLEVKGNQPTMFEDVKELFENVDERIELIETDRAAIDLNKHGNRKEYRAGYVRYDVDKLTYGHEWAGIKCIGAIHRKFDVDGQNTTDEWHYYISSRPLTADDLLKHARLEWGVESMHWLLDVHFDEDRMRLFNQNSLVNLNIIHKSALNLISYFKRSTNSKKAVSSIMRSCLFDLSFFDYFLSISFFPFLFKLL
jgi:predicted transposase YbfD/YdcC